MKERFLQQAKREYSPQQRLAALLVEAIFFMAIFPLALLLLGGRLDRWLGWPALLHPPMNAVIGGLLIVAGWLAGAPGCGRAADLHQGRGGAGDGRPLRGGVPGLSPPRAVHHSQAAQARLK
jgi:hypothetical protein